LDAHVNHRATLDGTVAQLQDAGFTASVAGTGSFTMRFADGSALFNHYFVQLGFLEGWRSIATAAELAAVEKKLNERGELALTIPMACFEAIKS
jgi:hypothetical protein